jgi:hypothetical protein
LRKRDLLGIRFAVDVVAKCGFDVRVPPNLLHGFWAMGLHAFRHGLGTALSNTSLVGLHILPLARAAIPVWKQKPAGILLPHLAQVVREHCFHFRSHAYSRFGFFGLQLAQVLG